MGDDQLDTIGRLVKKAEHDLLTSETMVGLHQPPLEIVCFHCQQCAEKYLKAFLVSEGVDFPKTHDLRRLVDLCAGRCAQFRELDDAALGLAGYAVGIRYGEDWRDIGLGEAREALQHASSIRTFVRSRLPRTITN
jgi:HEPN domain-containing protein